MRLTVVLASLAALACGNSSNPSQAPASTTASATAIPADGALVADATATPAAEPRPPSPPLSATLTASKSGYSVGEPIDLTVHIRNHRDTEIAIVHPDYWGVSEIRVTDENGAPVQAPRSFKAGRKAVAQLMTIAPGDTASHTLARATTYTCCHAYSFTGLAPGRYQIRVEITNPPVKVTRLPAGWKQDWTGTLRTPPVTIDITKP